MLQENFKVKGNDVNGYMVMENISYLNYSSKLLENFLINIGYSKPKLNILKVGFQKANVQIIHYKNLMFPQFFSTKLECKNITYNDYKMQVAIHFYNTNNELCKTVIRDLYWFDYNLWQTIIPPKVIANYFCKTFLN